MTKIIKYLAFFLLIINLHSCLPTAKLLFSMKNPKLQSVEKIEKSIDEIFLNNSSKMNIEDYYLKSEDSITIMKGFYSSIGNNITCYKNGYRQKYIGTDTTCGSLKFNDIVQNFEEVLVQDSDTTNSKDMLSYYNFKELKSNIKLISGSQNLNENKERIYVVYFWSKFWRANKGKRNSFLRFNEKLQTLDKDLTIIRINCDYRNADYKGFSIKFIKDRRTKDFGVEIEEKK